jgi:hypothetical protein
MPQGQNGLPPDSFEERAEAVAKALEDACGDAHEAALLARRAIVLLECGITSRNGVHHRRAEEPGVRTVRERLAYKVAALRAGGAE